MVNSKNYIDIFMPVEKTKFLISWHNINNRVKEKLNRTMDKELRVGSGDNIKSCETCKNVCQIFIYITQLSCLGVIYHDIIKLIAEKCKDYDEEQI